ncbi:MAG: hypothetical protein EOM54_11605 [Clostridia bacterium]|nr:hypothetical protein [Clostridia bacterium]
MCDKPGFRRLIPLYKNNWTTGFPGRLFLARVKIRGAKSIRLVLPDRELVLRQSMSALEKQIQIPLFFRCHTSCLVNFRSGDGICMAQDVGAVLWHMSNLSGPDIAIWNPTPDLSYYLDKATDAHPSAYSHVCDF